MNYGRKKSWKSKMNIHYLVANPTYGYDDGHRQRIGESPIDV